MAIYKKIFTLELKHEFYNNEFVNDFSIEPTPDCAKLFKNYGLILRETPTGFVVMGDTIDSGTKLKREMLLADRVKFTFYMILKNPRFLNFTHLPLTGNRGTLYYFNNIDAHTNASVNYLYPTSTGHYVNSANRINIGPVLFSHDFGGTPVSGSVTVTDYYNDSITVFEASDTYKGVKQFDLSKVKRGRYNIEVVDGAGTTVTSYYLDTEAASTGNVFGMIELFYNGDDDDVDVTTKGPASSFRFINSGTGNIAEKTYTLSFNNRETIWRYLIFPKNESSDFLLNNAHYLTDDFSVAGPSLAFARPVGVDTKGGTMFTFESTAKIPLTQQYSVSVEIGFKRVSGTPDFEIIKSMPKAAVELVKPASGYTHDDTYASANDKAYSEIFIYI